MSHFAAYIASFLPRDNDELRASRVAIHHKQLDWWVENTSVVLHVISMNYDPSDYRRDHEATGRVVYLDSPPMKLTPARRVGFEHFYASDAHWGIMMDDDAILYNKEQHNSGHNLIAEMDKQIEKYRTIGTFFPINPQKIGFNPIWDKKPELYRDNHVFHRNMDLKGSMFFVRNFRKYGQQEVLPDLNYNWQEDTKFAIDCVAAGHTVLQCHNIVLNELSGSASHFAGASADRVPKMLTGNSAIAAEYAHLGLQMVHDSHLLDKSAFLKKCWRGTTRLVVPKYQDDDSLFQ